MQGSLPVAAQHAARIAGRSVAATRRSHSKTDGIARRPNAETPTALRGTRSTIAISPRHRVDTQDVTFKLRARTIEQPARTQDKRVGEMQPESTARLGNGFCQHSATLLLE